MSTQFDYLLNAFEAAAHDDAPADVGYAEKRQALFAYVRKLEALAAPAPQPCDYPDCKCPTESPCLQGRPIAAPKTQAPSVGDRKPLSDEQAKRLLQQSDLLDMFLHIGWYSAPRKGFDQHALALIRAIEAAHGITAAPEGKQP